MNWLECETTEFFSLNSWLRNKPIYQSYRQRLNTMQLQQSSVDPVRDQHDQLIVFTSHLAVRVRLTHCRLRDRQATTVGQSLCRLSLSVITITRSHGSVRVLEGRPSKSMGNGKI